MNRSGSEFQILAIVLRPSADKPYVSATQHGTIQRAGQRGRGIV